MSTGSYRVEARLSSNGNLVEIKKFEIKQEIERKFLFWTWTEERTIPIESVREKCIEHAKKLWNENKGEFQDVIAKCSYGDGYNYCDILFWLNGKYL